MTSETATPDAPPRDLSLGPFARIFATGYDEMVRVTRGQRAELTDAQSTHVESVTRRAAAAEITHLESWMSLLGTIGSTAPFIGLFGTVVGIMRAFHHMAQTGAGGFAVVASGISEALVATALGLGVAIIAVALYNYFQVRLADLGTTMRVGITRFVDGVCAMRGERGTRQVA